MSTTTYTGVPPEGHLDAILRDPTLTLDIEGRDPDLEELGPGCPRNDGHISGVAFSGNKVSVYLPLRHSDITGATREINERIIQDLLLKAQPKAGANIIYDLEWLEHEGYRIQGPFLDVQYAEPLLDEYRYSYSLDALAKQYLKKTKLSHGLEQYAEAQGWKGKAIKHVWKMPASVVEPYAREDAELTSAILKEQQVKLEQQGLTTVFDMECRLIPLLLRMRQQGVRLDIPKLKKTAMWAADKKFAAYEQLTEMAGGEFNPRSPLSMKKVFDRLRIPYPLNEPTPKMKAKGLPGNPNMDKAVLKMLAPRYPICEHILEYRHYSTLINTFLWKYLDVAVGDRLFCSFHPLRSDKYGTVSGRFSSSKPNLQQVPSGDEVDEKDNVKGQLIRSLFLPEEGCFWAKLDYSQVEYRIGAHYAVDPPSHPGVSAALRKSYVDNPDIDYHKFVQDKTSFNRKVTKALNFGGAYGMGALTASKTFGWTLQEAELFMQGFHAAAPYLRATRNSVNGVAKRRGWIHTILGRKARVHPSRSLHSFYNRLIQGSAADVMKKGMVDAWDAGVFNTLHPHLTVHDELDVSVPYDSGIGREALIELKRIMEGAVKFSVPLKVDVTHGKAWAETPE